MRSLTLLLLLFILSVLIFLPTDSAKAQADIGDSENLGVGLMLGEPTGVSVKIWTDNSSAFGLGAAWSLTEREEAIHLHGDYLFHQWLNGTDNSGLAFYYGIGGRVIFADDPKAGARVPLGLNYLFQNIPFDLFVEAVPILDFTPDTEFAGNGAVGIRYYF